MRKSKQCEKGSKNLSGFFPWFPLPYSPRTHTHSQTHKTQWMINALNAFFLQIISQNWFLWSSPFARHSKNWQLIFPINNNYRFMFGALMSMALNGRSIISTTTKWYWIGSLMDARVQHGSVSFFLFLTDSLFGFSMNSLVWSKMELHAPFVRFSSFLSFSIVKRDNNERHKFFYLLVLLYIVHIYKCILYQWHIQCALWELVYIFI